MGLSEEPVLRMRTGSDPTASPCELRRRRVWWATEGFGAALSCGGSYMSHPSLGVVLLERSWALWGYTVRQQHRAITDGRRLRGNRGEPHASPLLPWASKRSSQRLATTVLTCRAQNSQESRWVEGICLATSRSLNSRQRTDLEIADARSFPLHWQLLLGGWAALFSSAYLGANQDQRSYRVRKRELFKSITGGGAGDFRCVWCREQHVHIACDACTLPQSTGW